MNFGILSPVVLAILLVGFSVWLCSKLIDEPTPRLITQVVVTLVICGAVFGLRHHFLP